MNVKSLRIFNFRNLADVEISFQNRITLIVGNNGQGKTNLLEALYLLSQAKSFRMTKPSGLVSWHRTGEEKLFEKSCAVTGSVESSAGEREVSYVVEKGKGKVFVNGKQTVTASEFYGQVQTVLFTPEDLQLVKGSPGERRQFLDRTIAMIDRTFVEHLVSYERALRSRNELLRSFKGKKQISPALGKADQEKELAVWDEALIQHGSEVAKKRHTAVIAMSRSFKKYYEFLSSFELEEVMEEASLEYRSKFFSDGESLSVPRLRELFLATRTKDLHFNQTTFGIHRDDLDLFLENTYGEKMAKLSASQGQARSIVLALKFSSLDYLQEQGGESPILLLDDVESELDERRKAALYELLTERKNQILITSNKRSLEFERHVKKAGIFTVKDGHVKSAQEWKN